MMTRRIGLVFGVSAALTIVWALGPAADETVAVKAGKVSARAFGYDDAVARLDAALERLRARAAMRDDDWLTVEALAAGYMERAKLTGDWEDFRRAESELDRAFSRAPAGAGPHLTQATLDYALHRFDRVEASLAAIDAYAVADAETRRAVRSMHADLLLQTGRYDAAGAMYAELLEESRTRDALVGAAGHLWHTGQRTKADALLAEAERASSGADALTRAWLCLARGLLALDDARLDDALAHYERGLALLPGWYLLEEHIAEVLAEKGDSDRALAMYRGLIARTGDPEFMDAAAEILSARGAHTEARALFARAHAGHEARIAMFPEAAYGHALGHYLAHEGDTERAVAIAERNRDVRPNGEAWTQLARAYAAAGRTDEARAVIAQLRSTPYRSLDLDETATHLASR